MNVYDSGKMAALLKPLGYGLTDDQHEADVAILNTCHIRKKAEQRVFSDLGRLHNVKKDRQSEGKQTIIAVGGCVAQAEGDQILKQAPYVNMVFGPQTYHRLPEMLAKVLREKGEDLRIVDTDFPTESKFDQLPLDQSFSYDDTQNKLPTAFLTIQEGCDKFCTFCCVPYTRGAEASRPVKDILDEARHLVAGGIKDITLLGQNVNAYHGVYDGPIVHRMNTSTPKEWDLARLLCALAEIKGLERLRYTTSHPRDVNDALIAAHRDLPTLMPYLHLPVQSGSDRILEAMNRKHTVAFYLDLIEKFRKARPDMAFSSDFIVGFPGETKADHQQTLDLVRYIQYAQAYSFKYSIRPGTPAGIYDLQVEENVKEERLKELQSLLVDQQITSNESCVGLTIPVLFERDGRHAGQLIGRSPYMQSVYASASKRHMNEISLVKIEKATQNSISGVIETEESIVHA